MSRGAEGIDGIRAQDVQSFYVLKIWFVLKLAVWSCGHSLACASESCSYIRVFETIEVQLITRADIHLIIKIEFDHACRHALDKLCAVSGALFHAHTCSCTYITTIHVSYHKLSVTYYIRTCTYTASTYAYT